MNPKINVKVLLIFLFSLTFYSVKGQNILHGTLKTSSQEAVPFANIIAYTLETKDVISFTSSNEWGIFQIDIQDNSQVILEITAIGYKKFVAPISFSQDSITITLEEDVLELKEVTIEAISNKDTVDFDLEDLNLTDQSTLGDILSKINGIEVSDNGAIMANGRPITRILVNDKEVFINQNKIALDNITNDIIEHIQLINNYQDRFDIQFENRVGSVINIDTKDKFKGVAKFDIEMSGGHRNSFLAKGKGMFFSDKVNGFLTQNTNNILNRDFTSENLSPFLGDYVSSVFENTIDLFTDENENVSKDFSNGTSLTLRREFNKVRFSSVLYYNFLQQTVDLLTNRSNVTNRINEETNQNQFNAHFASVDLSLNYLINRKSLLLYDFNTGIAANRKRKDIDQINFFPIQNFLNIQDRIQSNSSAFSKHLVYKYQINKQIIFSSDASWFYEDSKNDLSSNLNDSESLFNLNQNIDFNNQRFAGKTDLDIKFNNFISLVSGLEYSFAREKIFQSILNDSTDTDQRLTRDDQQLGLAFTLRGDDRDERLSYYFKALPTIRKLSITDPQTINYVPILASLVYDINSREGINAYFERRFETQDLFRTLNTFYNSLNNIVFSDQILNFQLTRTSNVGVQYRYNHIPKSQYFSLSLSFNQTQNTLQSVFLELRNNALFYRNFLINRQSGYSGILKFSKAYYTPQKLHKISFGATLQYDLFNGETIQDQRFNKIQNHNFQPKLKISFEPQEWFFKELNLTLNYNHNVFNLAQILRTEQNELLTAFELIGEGDKLYYKFKFYYNNFSLDDQRFFRTDIDFELKYQLKETLSLTCQSASLLNLFNISNNNISNLNTFTSEGIVTQTVNPSILGYLVAGIQIKF